jgi:hypothetical protein
MVHPSTTFGSTLHNHLHNRCFEPDFIDKDT